MRAVNQAERIILRFHPRVESKVKIVKKWLMRAWIRLRRLFYGRFSNHKHFDSRKIARLDVLHDRGNESRNLVFGVQQQAYTKRGAIGGRNTIKNVWNANHSYKAY